MGQLQLLLVIRRTFRATHVRYLVKARAILHPYQCPSLVLLLYARGLIVNPQPAMYLWVQANSHFSRRDNDFLAFFRTSVSSGRSKKEVKT